MAESILGNVVSPNASFIWYAMAAKSYNLIDATSSANSYTVTVNVDTYELGILYLSLLSHNPYNVNFNGLDPIIVIPNMNQVPFCSYHGTSLTFDPIGQYITTTGSSITFCRNGSSNFITSVKGIFFIMK